MKGTVSSNIKIARFGAETDDDVLIWSDCVPVPDVNAIFLSNYQ